MPCIASSADLIVKLPPDISTVPAEVVSSSSGPDLIPSFPAFMSNVPPVIISLPSLAIPVFATFTL